MDVKKILEEIDFDITTNSPLFAIYNEEEATEEWKKEFYSRAQALGIKDSDIEEYIKN